MLNITNELREKLLAAKSAEEVTELVKADGQEITAEEAEQILQEISQHREEKELSPDELEAVSGGDHRNWLTQGCAATVEDDSWCWSDDWCKEWDVTYYNRVGYCGNCARYKMDHIGFDAEQRRIYECPGCGRRLVVEAFEYNSRKK